MSKTVIVYEAPVDINIGDTVYGIPEVEHVMVNGSRVSHFAVKRFVICGISAETTTESWSAANLRPEVRFTAFRRYGRSYADFARISFLPHQIDPISMVNRWSVFTSYSNACIVADKLNADQDAIAIDAGVNFAWKEKNDRKV